MTDPSPILELISHSGVLVDDIGAYVEFVAVIDDMVQVSPATRFDPEEFGSAVCQGKVYLEEDADPQTPADFRAIAETVYEWEINGN